MVDTDTLASWCRSLAKARSTGARQTRANTAQLMVCGEGEPIKLIGAFFAGVEEFYG